MTFAGIIAERRRAAFAAAAVDRRAAAWAGAGRTGQTASHAGRGAAGRRRHRRATRRARAGRRDHRVAYDLAYISASWLDKRVLYVNGTGMRMDADGPFAGREEPRSCRRISIPPTWKARSPAWSDLNCTR